MMNSQMDGWYSGMGSGSWMFGILILAVVLVVAFIVSRKK